MSVGELTVSIIGDMTRLSRVFSQASNEAGKFGKSVTSLGSSMTSKLGSALSTIGTAALATGTALGAGLAYETYKSVTAFKTFEQAVANTASVVGVTGDAFEKAKENIAAVAQELGQKTVFSSTDAANAMYNLASAGYDVSTMGASDLVPMLNLASGTQYDLAETTNILASTLSQFGLGFESAGKVADIYAKSIGVSQASMDKLGISMNYVGPIANSMGISIEKTTAALSVLYNAGLKGEQAGTGLRSVLSDLVNPSKAAADALAAMGITLDQVNPSTNELTDIIQLLADKGLNSAQAFEIFGQVGAPAILSLTSKTGELKTLTEELYNVGGAAQTMADQQLDTLSGSLEALSGSIENLFINIGQALAPTIRQVAGYLDEMMPSIQNFIVGIVNSFVSFAGKLGESAPLVMAAGESILEVFSNIFEAIAGNGKGIASSAADVINGIMQRIAGIIIDIAPRIQSAVIGIIGFFKNLATSLKPTWTSLSSIATRIITLFREMFSGISGTSSSIAGIINKISATLARFTVVATTALIQALPAIKSVFSAISNAVRDAIPAIKNVFNTISKAFSEIDINPTINSIKSTFEKIDFAGIFGSIISTIKKIDFSAIFDSIKSAFTEGKKIILGFVKDLAPSWDNLKSSFDSIKDILKDLSPAFTTFFDSLGGSGSGAASTALEVLADVINTVTDAVADLLKWLADNPKIVKFGLALAGVAVAAGGLVIGLAGLITALTPVFASIVTGITFVSGLSLSWASLGEVIALIGTSLFPTLSAAISTVGSVAIPILTAAFSALSTVIGIVVYTVIPILVEALGLLISPMGLIVVAIGALYLAWKNNWLGFRDIVNTVGSGIKTAASNLVTGLKAVWDKMPEHINILKQQCSNAWQSIVNLFSSVKTSLVNAVNGLKTGLQSVYTSIISAITNLKGQVWTAWNSIITTYNTAKTSLVNAVKSLSTGLSSVYNSIKTALQTLVSNWISKFNEWISKTKSLGTSLHNELVSRASKITAIAGNFGNAVVAIRNKFVDKFNELISKAKSLGTTLYNDLISRASKIQTVASNFGNAVVAIRNKFVDRFNEMISKTKTMGAQIYNELIQRAEKIKTVGSNWWNAGLAIVNKFVDSLKAGLDRAKSVVSNGLDKINNLLPHSPAKEGPFRILPNWDAVLIDPLRDSIIDVSKLSNPLSRALSDVRSPIDSKMQSGLGSVSNVSTTSNTYGGDTLVLENVNISNNMDLQSIFTQFEQFTANKRRQRGYI